MTLKDFAAVFAMLAKQLRATDADEADIRAYYKALQDLDLELVAMAAEHMGQSGGALSENPHWFPKASEWRTQVGIVERKRRGLLEKTIRQRQRDRLPPLCAGCDDTGWERDEQNRVHRCACHKLRRLEILGRRPWPALPAAVDQGGA